MDRNREIKLEAKIESIATNLEKLKIAEYVDLMNNKRRLLYVNFIGGLARGFGMAIGFTLLGAFVIYILQRAINLNLPLIGDFIAEIVKIVQNSL